MNRPARCALGIRPSPRPNKGAIIVSSAGRDGIPPRGVSLGVVPRHVDHWPEGRGPSPDCTGVREPSAAVRRQRQTSRCIDRIRPTARPRSSWQPYRVADLPEARLGSLRASPCDVPARHDDHGLVFPERMPSARMRVRPRGYHGQRPQARSRVPYCCACRRARSGRKLGGDRWSRQAL